MDVAQVYRPFFNISIVIKEDLHKRAPLRSRFG